MPVEIRELVIRTNITSSNTRGESVLETEKLVQLKQQIVQECIKVLKDRTPKNSFDR